MKDFGIALITCVGALVILSLLPLLFRVAGKVAGKLRLGLPLVYFVGVVISTFFTDWAIKNEGLALMGLYILLGLVAISWIYSLVKAVRSKYHDKQYEKAFEADVAWQLRRARELGIATDRITISEDGTVLHADTKEPIVPIQNHGRPF